MMFKGITPREWYVTVGLITTCLGLFAFQGYRAANQSTVQYKAKPNPSTVVAPVALVNQVAAPLPPTAQEENPTQPAAEQPIEQPPMETASPAFENGQLEINRATAKDFETLPGIGPVTAESIVAYRNQIGGTFHSVEQLDEVSGIGEKTMERLKPLLFMAPIAGNEAQLALVPNAIITQHSPSSLSTPQQLDTTGRVNINTAGLEELQKLSGIGEKKAEAILLDRQQNGPYRRVDDLQRVPGIGPKTIEKNRHLIILRSP